MLFAMIFWRKHHYVQSVMTVIPHLSFTFFPYAVNFIIFPNFWLNSNLCRWRNPLRMHSPSNAGQILLDYLTQVYMIYLMTFFHTCCVASIVICLMAIYDTEILLFIPWKCCQVFTFLWKEVFLWVIIQESKKKHKLN